MQGITQLKTYRNSKEPKLSQAGLAKELGVSRLTVTRWESGARKINPSLVAEITKKTGIPAKELRPDFAKTYGEKEKAESEAAQ